MEDFSKLSDSKRDEVMVPQLNVNGPENKKTAIQSFTNTIQLSSQISFTQGLMFN
jgi:hypothetical protein